MNIPTDQDDESLERDSLEKDSPDRVVRYAEDLRPLRDVDEPRVFHGYQRRGPERQLPWGPILGAAAVGFVIALVFGPCRNTDPLQQGELANMQAELQTARDRAGQLESELAQHESVGKADAPDERSASEREQQAAPPPPKHEEKTEAREQKTEVKTASTPKQEHRAELTPEEVLRRQDPTEPTENSVAAVAAKADEPPAPAVPAPAPVSDPSPEPSQTEPDRVALAESQGTVSVYDDPDPAAPVVRSTSRSGTPGRAVMQVLAPERAGWTTKAQPTLYWLASENIQSPGEFTLTREGEDEPLVRGRLSAPDGAGIQRIELSQTDTSLEEGASYRWTISFGDEALATGGIRRVSPPEMLHATAGATPVVERLDALERAGLWYDALDLVIRSIEDNSGAKNLVARRRAMLARVGIQLPG